MVGNQSDLVAYTDTAGQPGAGGSKGALRLVLPGDRAGGRYVSNLVSLQVIDTTTEHHAQGAGRQNYCRSASKIAIRTASGWPSTARATARICPRSVYI